MAFFSAEIKQHKVAAEVGGRKPCTVIRINKASLAIAYGTQKLMSAVFQLSLNARLTLIVDAFPALPEKQNQPVVFV